MDAVRALDGVEVRALPDSEGAQPPAAWSYDSRWALFSIDNKLKKVYIQGGPAQDIADLPGFLTGAGWNPDGVIIAAKGGASSIWRADGKELYYNFAGRVMAVDIDTSKGFSAGTPRHMFDSPANVGNQGWDLSPDGKRFLFVAPPGADRVIPFTVVLNWAAGVKK